MFEFFSFVFLVSLLITFAFLVWWIITLMRMKPKVISGEPLGKLTAILAVFTAIIFFVSVSLDKPSSTSHSSASEKKVVGNHKMYGVNVTKITAKEEAWLISGTTSAPDGYKILATPTSKDNWNYPTQISEASSLAAYPKVKNGKFKLLVSPMDVIKSDNGKVGEKNKVTIFAVSKLSQSWVDITNIPKWSRSMCKDKTNSFTLTLTKKQVAYIRSDDDENSSSNSDSSTDSTDDDSQDSSSDTPTTKSDKSAMRDYAVSTLQKNYDGVADVSYDYENKAINIRPTDDSFVEEVQEVQSGELSRSEWRKMTDGLDKASEGCYDLGVHVPLNIVNPTNSDRILYSTYDGVSVYDMFDH